MRRPSEKPFRTGMQFFTPELVMQINSADDRVVEQGHEVWEQAIQHYQKQLGKLRQGMPWGVRDLSHLSLHDWEVVPVDQPLGSMATAAGALPVPVWFTFALFALRHQGGMIVLHYALWDPLRTFPPPDRWPFSKERRHWLYDELSDVADRPGLYLHRVLFSDGVVMEVPFTACSVYQIPVHPVAEAEPPAEPQAGRPRVRKPA